MTHPDLPKNRPVFEAVIHNPEHSALHLAVKQYISLECGISPRSDRWQEDLTADTDLLGIGPKVHPDATGPVFVASQPAVAFCRTLAACGIDADVRVLRPPTPTTISPEQQLANLAGVVTRYTEKQGRGYVADKSTMAAAARQLAEAVTAYLAGELGPVEGEGEF